MSRIIFVTVIEALCDLCESLCDLCGYLPQRAQREAQSTQSIKVIEANVK